MASDRPVLADVARASVRATRKKSEFPIACLAAAIFAACSSAGIIFKTFKKTSTDEY